MLRTTNRAKPQRLLPTHLLPHVRTNDSPLVVWRTWLIAPDHRHGAATVPMLTGLMGFPWRGSELDAKCTIQDPNRIGLAFNQPTLDRHHPRIPDPDCTCGVYARRGDLESPPMDLVPRGLPTATGFVELSGHVLQNGENSRASHARIIGPLHILAGRMPLTDCLLRRAGVERSPTTITVEKHAYRVGWSAVSSGTPIAEWRSDAVEHLRHRYGVEVA